jgi:uncharacterized protein YukE
MVSPERTLSRAADPIAYPNLWNLNARPDVVESAAIAWRSYADDADRIANHLDRVVSEIYDTQWAGESADAFEAHRRRVTGDLRETGRLARQHADHLDTVAAVLRTGQRALEGAFTELCRRVGAQVTADRITFYPETPEEAQLVHDAAAHALRLRQDIDAQLQPYEQGLRGLRQAWESLAAAWAETAAGADPFPVPEDETDVPVVVRDGDTVVVTLGGGNDQVAIRTGTMAGHEVVVIEVAGRWYVVPADRHIVVYAGGGDDTITVAPGTTVRLTLIGGSGDDMIQGGDGAERILGGTGNDTLWGGAGNDHVSGGAGRDYLDGYHGHDTLVGGEGDDVLYGLAGDDRLSGGAGADYLEGAMGRDVLDGGVGADVLSGGRDDDTLRGGGGDDVLYAGAGRDILYGGSGTDTAHLQREDTTGGSERIVTVPLKDLGTQIKIQGSAEFVERVQADLDLLRSSPRGQQMLTALDGFLVPENGPTLTIVEDEDNLTVPRGTGYHVLYSPANVTANDGLPPDYPAGPRPWAERPPVVGLYHELAHVYARSADVAPPGHYHGADDPGLTVSSHTGYAAQAVPNAERAVIGLPIDPDGDGHAELYPAHPYELTENALREEMGLRRRETYGPPPAAGHE